MLTQAAAAPPHFSPDAAFAAARDLHPDGHGNSLGHDHDLNHGLDHRQPAAAGLLPSLSTTSKPTPTLRRQGRNRRITMPSSNAAEYRHSRTGSLNIPPANGHAAGSMMAAMSGARFDGPRSPPNTSHVPCKFFRQGACQAGKACPFSHDLGAAAENICKYFAKGNCKFGPKCANIHVLPDGRRINYSKNGVTIGATPIALGSRVNPTSSSAYNQPQSALTTSLYQNNNGSGYTVGYPYGDERQHQLGRQPSLENGLPTIDTPYSHPGSNYGSPRDDESTRFGLGLSPVAGKGLSVLDAPLPASFDSNGISNAARYPGGPWPSSVPSKFGLESPSSSLTTAKESRTSEALKLLHTSAFGSSEHLNTAPSSSPPTAMGGGEEYFGKRTMHSSRYSKPKMLSSSVPKTTVDRDWEAEFAFLEEDYVPQNLQDLLTPAEKARRGSLRADGEQGDSTTKFGSPMGASPGRWGPVFQRQRDEEEITRSARLAPSAFGHVGSPLRNSSLAHEMDKGIGGSSRPRPGSRQGSSSESLSVLTQQIQRTRLSDDGGSSPHLHPNTAVGRVPSNGTLGSITKERVIERHVSSGSIGSSVTGRFTTPIDEEDAAFVFSMEEVDEQQTNRLRKRGSGLGASSWSYAGVVSGKGSSLNPGGKEPSVGIETVGGR